MKTSVAQSSQIVVGHEVDNRDMCDKLTAGPGFSRLRFLKHRDSRYLAFRHSQRSRLWSCSLLRTVQRRWERCRVAPVLDVLLSR